jgi:Zn-dependent protease
VDQIVLWPLGGYTLCSVTEGAVSDDLWIAVMGPATHIPQALIWLGVYAVIQKGDLSGMSNTIDLDELKFGGPFDFACILAVQAIIMNAFLFICNLGVPAYPLDGGRCFAVFLVMFGFSPKVSAVLTSITAISIGLTMVYYGTYLFVVQKSGSGVFIALIAIFICYSSLQLCKVASSETITDHPLFDRDCYREIGTQAICTKMTEQESINTGLEANTEQESTSTALKAKKPTNSKSSDKPEIIC